jgi:hypothetical protein
MLYEPFRLGVPYHQPRTLSQIFISSSNGGQITWDASMPNGDSISMTSVHQSGLSVVTQRSLRPSLSFRLKPLVGRFTTSD